MVEIIKLDNVDVEISAMATYVLKEGEPGFAKCPDEVMVQFLNGLVFFKRGKDDTLPAPEIELQITNNLVLKKLHVAFELKDTDDLHQIFSAVDFLISKSELSALFRKAGTKNYRPCGDQMLRYFLKEVWRSAFMARNSPATAMQGAIHRVVIAGWDGCRGGCYADGETFEPLLRDVRQR